MKSLPKTFNWNNFKDFCWRTFLFIWIKAFNFLSLNFKIALSLFFSRWHACKSPGVTSYPVREIALHTVSFIPNVTEPRVNFQSLPPVYWALMTAFRSNWIIRWCRRVLQFFVINKSDFNSSCLAEKISNPSPKTFNWQLMSDN